MFQKKFGYPKFKSKSRYTYYPSIQMRPKCNQTHDRDINASINILNV